MTSVISRQFSWLLAAILAFSGLSSVKGALDITFEDNGIGIDVFWSGSGTTVGSGNSILSLELTAGVLTSPGQSSVSLTQNSLKLTLNSVDNNVNDFGFFAATPPSLPNDGIDIRLTTIYGSGISYSASGSAVINLPFNTVFSNTGTFNVINNSNPTEDVDDFGGITVNVVPEPSTWFAGVVAFAFVVVSIVKRQRLTSSDVSS